MLTRTDKVPNQLLGLGLFLYPIVVARLARGLSELFPTTIPGPAPALSGSRP
jgi:hypothetical protein